MPKPTSLTMTGGSQRAKEINQQLGIIAKETGLLVATGSVSAALKDASLADTYQIMRKERNEVEISTSLTADSANDW